MFDDDLEETSVIHEHVLIDQYGYTFERECWDCEELEGIAARKGWTGLVVNGVTNA
jgi:hypothetical protein